MVAGPGLAATGVSFVLLVAPAGPLWLALALLGFGLALVTSATLRDLVDAHAPTRLPLESRARRARDARAKSHRRAARGRDAAVRPEPGLDRYG